jgi:hypothetical protein
MIIVYLSQFSSIEGEFDSISTRRSRGLRADDRGGDRQSRLPRRGGAAPRKVAEAMTLARSEELDAYQMLGEHYAGIRRWAPAFLDAFVFQSVPAAAALMRAIDTLRDMNRRAVPSSACCRNCATACAPVTAGWSAAGDIAPSSPADGLRGRA